MFNYDFSADFSGDFDSIINLDYDTVIEVDNPYIGLVVISDVDGQSLIVTKILRYNGSGRFTCNLTDNLQLFNTCLDVYYNDILLAWHAKRYIPERYRDEDGVNKGM